MSEMRVNSEIEDNNDQNMQGSNKISSIQINQWEKIKILISKNVKEIFWKAWIKPLKFEKYEKGILHLSTDSKIISNRAETQYYETIFFQASIFFSSLKKIQFHIVSFKQKENVSSNAKVQKVRINQLTNYSDLSFIDSISMKRNSKFTFFSDI